MSIGTKRCGADRRCGCRSLNGYADSNCSSDTAIHSRIISKNIILWLRAHDMLLISRRTHPKCSDSKRMWAPTDGERMVHTNGAPAAFMASEMLLASWRDDHATPQPPPPEPTTLNPQAPAWTAASRSSSSLGISESFVVFRHQSTQLLAQYDRAITIAPVFGSIGEGRRRRSRRPFPKGRGLRVAVGAGGAQELALVLTQKRRRRRRHTIALVRTTIGSTIPVPTQFLQQFQSSPFAAPQVTQRVFWVRPNTPRPRRPSSSIHRDPDPRRRRRPRMLEAKRTAKDHHHHHRSGADHPPHRQCDPWCPPVRQNASLPPGGRVGPVAVATDDDDAVGRRVAPAPGSTPRKRPKMCCSPRAGAVRRWTTRRSRRAQTSNRPAGLRAGPPAQNPARCRRRRRRCFVVVVVVVWQIVEIVVRGLAFAAPRSCVHREGDNHGTVLLFLELRAAADTRIPSFSCLHDSNATVQRNRRGNDGETEIVLVFTKQAKATGRAPAC